MSISSSAPSSTVHQGGFTTISAVHSDIIQTHILTRLDGPGLASASCASSLLHALTSEDKLWRDISAATWPSINTPRVQDLISSFPSGHRSFFSDSFPLLTHASANHHRSGLPSELISAVDIYYKNEVIFSKVRETDTEARWFRCTPFRVDLLDPKESVPTSILHAGEGGDKVQSQLEENLIVSWIVIDPTRKRAANLSSLRPVSVQRHWLSGEMQVRFGSIFAGDSKNSEFVQCVIVVTCGGKEGGELHVKEVSMQVEDMDGRILDGEESLVILQGALETGKRKKGKSGERKERYVEYLEMKRERIERKERRERRLDMVCMCLGFTIFIAFWCFVLLR